MAKILEAGDKAPKFDVPNQDGNMIKLDSGNIGICFGKLFILILIYCRLYQYILHFKRPISIIILF